MSRRNRERRKANMETKGRSTLMSQVGKLIGFGFAPHPINGATHYVEVVFYKTPTEYVLCLSEGAGQGDPVSQRIGLGDDVPGAMFAPYAQRSIEGKLPYDEFKNFMNETMPESMPGIKLEWYK